MKKLLTVIVMALCMVVTAVPAMVFAEGTASCDGGESCTHTASVTDGETTTHYSSLNEAVKAVPENGTVTMLKKAVYSSDNAVDLKNYPKKTFYIDTTENKFGIGKILSYTTKIEGATGYWGEIPYTHLQTKEGNIYKFSPASADYTAAVYKSNDSSSLTYPPCSIPDGGNVYYYTTLKAAFDAASTSNYHNAIVLLKNVEGDVTVEKGPANNKMVNLILNGKNFTGKIEKTNYDIIESDAENEGVKADGVKNYLFRYINADLTVGSETRKLYSEGSYYKTMETANEAAAEAEGPVKIVFRAASVGFAANEIEVNDKITWEIPEGQTINLNGKGIMTVNGKVILEGNIVLSRTAGFRVKEGSEIDIEKISGGLDKPDLKIVSETSDGYTTYSVAYVGASPAVSYRKPGSSTWVPYQAYADAEYAAQTEPGGTIRLEKDCSAIPYINNYTLDLNGYTLTAGISSSGATFGPSAVITDSSSSGSGKIARNRSSAAVLTAGASGGDLTIKAGTVLNTGGFGIVLQTAGDCKASVTVEKDASIEAGQYGIIVQQDSKTGNDYADTAVNVYGKVSGGYAGLYINGNVVYKENDTTVFNIGKDAVITCSSSDRGAGIYAAGYGEWKINGGEIGGYSGVYMKSGVMNISDGKIFGTGIKSGYEYKGGAFKSTGDAFVADSCGYPGGAPVVNITGGYFSGLSEGTSAVGSYIGNNVTEKSSISVSGGYFTSNPSEFITADSMVMPSDKVGEKVENTVAVKPASGEPSVNSDAIADLTEETKTQVENAASDIAVSGLEAYANKETANVTQTQADAAKQQLIDDVNGNGENYSDTVKEAVKNNSIYIYSQTYLEVTPKEYSAEDTSAVFTVDITPMVRLIASTAETQEDIKLENISEEAEKNAIVLADSEDTINVKSTVTVTIPLPAGFASAGDTVYVKHIKSNSEVYIYKCTVKGTESNGIYVEFVNTNGFSEFSVVKSADTAASITRGGSTMYFASLQDAVDKVQNGETIVIEADGVTGTAVVERELSFILDTNGKEGFEGNITAGKDITMTKSEADGTKTTYEFDCSKPSGGGGGAVIPPEEPVTDENPFTDVKADDYFYDSVIWAVKNGVTEGIEETLFGTGTTCTRAQAVTFLWRAAGSPDQSGAEIPFEDVSAEDYFSDAVIWAVKNGITEGTSETTFSPNAECTRAHIVTFLWRSEKSPESSALNPFTDVKDGEYYRTAVLWAVENGITKGTTETAFSPEGDCTREQIVTFIYRSCANNSFLRK
ncbi:MAG: S-layer homology domain-containing protein [Bacillota bacterium]|nr:S-layer homology domain-containing protein [Bacillota bacterium]